MRFGTLPKWLLTSLLAVLSCGCLTQRKVTSNGEVISQEYIIKRPLQDD